MSPLCQHCVSMVRQHGHQPVLDPYACIMYIVSYITKDEREMGEILHPEKKEHSDNDIWSQMKKIIFVFLTHREFRAQEAAFHLLGLTMLSCTVIVPTDLTYWRQPSSGNVRYRLWGYIHDWTWIRYTARLSLLEDVHLADFGVEYDVYYTASCKDSDVNEDYVQPTTVVKYQYNNITTLNDGMGNKHHRKHSQYSDDTTSSAPS